MQRKVFRIEQMLAGKPAGAPVAAEFKALSERRDLPRDASVQTLQRELHAIRDTIARNRRELDALVVDGKERRLPRAASELGAAVDGMEKATVKILKSSEIIEDSAKALAATLKSEYECGLTQDIQDQVVEIYQACNFQDLAGQRIGKVIAILGAIEQQVAAMIARTTPTVVAVGNGRALLNGPKLEGDAGHASQRDIDKMFG
ncbi:MAG TPA: protein phosphatase CheZ [Pseudolabrys sp.]|nr:protein phosphatase CheZ [Pseudolabrys sp.]